jgi:hypothetical protein
VRDSVQFWHEADLSTYFCNVRFWGVEMPAIATGRREAAGRREVAESSRSAFRPRTREADAENTQAGWQLLTLEQTRVAA